MQLTYSGIRNDLAFKPPSPESVPKYERQRRRKTDTRVKLNKPFIFFVYDPALGILNYGEVLRPALPSDSVPMVVDPMRDLPPHAKMLSDVSTLKRFRS